ncbi:uncharacterized protein LOC125683793 isoform X3 [Ostrea edulis]|uniref:uncharacterized protein LOC125683793 isoform X3 n=1 Tax=Ostrea edulis TaxID=37623 RepID=UPI0024AEF1CC|nr:uncharacterized protein LOC125683793 isoform X3 [Ostrea edulis]
MTYNNTGHRDYVVEDPVVLAVLGGIGLFVVIAIFRVMHRKISRQRPELVGSRIGRIHRTLSSISCLRDDPPPPYPGKYSKTNLNYLPSYDSALTMERERRDERRGLTDSPEGVASTVFSISSDSESSSADLHMDCERIHDETNDRQQNGASSLTGVGRCESERQLNNVNTNALLRNNHERHIEDNFVVHQSSNAENSESSSQDTNGFNIGTITREYS